MRISQGAIMPKACPHCGNPTPAAARFCITCGAILDSSPTRAAAQRDSATGPTLRLVQPGAAHRRSAPSPRDGIPLVGLLFGAAFLVGFAQILANGGLRGPSASLVGVLLCGALLAERAWVNGEIWIGLRGMILWGGLTGLLAIGRVFPWGLLLIPVWLLIWLHARGRP